MTLVDEKGYEWPTKYLERKTGLSGGWKGYAVDHELVDGDALVFQLIKPTKFKVIFHNRAECISTFQSYFLKTCLWWNLSLIF